MGIMRVADDVEARLVVGAGGGGGTATTTTEPLLRHCHGGRKEEDDQGSKIRDSPEAEGASDCGRTDGGSLRMVLVSTAVAVCGSFEFGTCVRRRRCRRRLSLNAFLPSIPHLSRKCNNNTLADSRSTLLMTCSYIRPFLRQYRTFPSVLRVVAICFTTVNL
jgi:hypothetical protein